MKRFFHIVVASLLVAAPLHARLGDTERQCITRYGSAKPTPKTEILRPVPLIPGARESVYEYQGCKIRPAFIGDRVVAGEYTKPYNHPNGSKIIDAEIAAILEAEKGGLSWGRPHVDASKGLETMIANALMSPFSDRVWDRTDGAKATLRVQLALVLESPESIRARSDAPKKNATDQLRRVPKF